MLGLTRLSENAILNSTNLKVQERKGFPMPVVCSGTSKKGMVPILKGR